MDKPYISTTPVNLEKCLLCNKECPIKGSRAIGDKGWDNLMSKAEEWSLVNVPISDNFYYFTRVSDKVKDTKDAFGRRHECCRIKFSSLLNKYLNDLGTIVSPLDDSDCSNKCDSQLNLSNSSESATRVTRTSSTFIKSFEKICFVCIDVRESDDNFYNSGGLARCALNSASANIVRAKDVFLQDENHKFHTAAQRVNILLSGQSHDVHAADIYHHQSCYLHSVCNRPKKNVSDDAAGDEQSVLADFFYFYTIEHFARRKCISVDTTS